jgi:hypothetical protein
MRLISAVSGVQVPAPPPLNLPKSLTSRPEKPVCKSRVAHSFTILSPHTHNDSRSLIVAVGDKFPQSPGTAPAHGRRQNHRAGGDSHNRCTLSSRTIESQGGAHMRIANPARGGSLMVKKPRTCGNQERCSSIGSCDCASPLLPNYQPWNLEFSVEYCS